MSVTSTAPERIRGQRRVEAAVALDTIEALTTRITNLLRWDRRIAMTERYTWVNHPPRLHVGLTVDVDGINTRANRGDDGTLRSAWLHVRLHPGILTGFGIGVDDSRGPATEADGWRRYRAGEAVHADWSRRRRNITVVTITGGMDGDTGPAADDLLIIKSWNDDGVCDERVIGFDTELAWYRDEKAES